MNKSNFTKFEEQLQEVVEKYPNLRVVKNGLDTPFLRGILDIPDENGEIVGSFLIEIKCSQGFPFRFPTLYEIGGDIPNEADRHKYPDSRCCITVNPDEILKCKNGISIVYFILEFAIPFFANQIYFKQNQEYKNGEYSHGSVGIFQFYESLLKTSKQELWLTYFKHAFRGLKVSCGRNDHCLCGSRIKFKKCHHIVFDTLRQIGENQVYQDFNNLIK